MSKFVRELIELNKSRHKLISLTLAMFFISIFGMAGTYAWENLGQRVFNTAYQETPVLEVHVMKREMDQAGNPTDRPVAGATFILWNVETDEQVRDDAFGRPIGPTFVTDSEGRISFILSEGEFCLIETLPPSGFGFELDGDNEAITKHCFLVVNQDGELVLIINEDEVEYIAVYNRRLSGDLGVEKKVENEDGTDLTLDQLEQVFRFSLSLFNEDDEELMGLHAFRIYNGTTLVEGDGTLTSGDWFELKHGWRAVFPDLPVGIRYEVSEDVPPGYIMSGHDTNGVITPGDHVASFVNTAVEEEVPDPEYGNIIVEKYVIGSSEDRQREFEFTVTVDDEVFVFYLRHGERWTSDQFPVGAPFEVVEHEYEGVIASPSRVTGEVTSSEQVITFRNYVRDENDEEGDLIIEKRVIGEAPNPNQRFNFRLTLEGLPIEWEDEEENGFAIITLNGEDVSVTAPRWEWQFSLADGEQLTLENVPAGVNYFVRELEADGFIQGVSAQAGVIIGESRVYVNFRNEVIPENPDPDPEEGELEICKVLTDSSLDSDAVFNFELWLDGTLSEIFTLEAGACRVFTELEAGVIYQVREINMPSGYRWVRTDRSTGTIVADTSIQVKVFNENVEMEIPVEKKWHVESPVTLPAYIEVLLYANDILIQRVTVRPNQAGHWQHLFTVPRYDGQGEAITYRIEEVPIPGWIDDVREVDDGFVITNTPIDPVESAGILMRKQITGPFEGERQFEFELSGISGAPMPDPNRVWITGEGQGRFGEMTFTEAGVFEYVVREIVPSDTGDFVYDTATFNVRITVGTNDGGQLVINTTQIFRNGEDPVDEIVFTNRYEAVDEGESPLPPGGGEEIEPPVQPTPQLPVQSVPPHTGDRTQFKMWLALMLLSSIGIIVMWWKYRQQLGYNKFKKEDDDDDDHEYEEEFGDLSNKIKDKN